MTELRKNLNKNLKKMIIQSANPICTEAIF